MYDNELLNKLFSWGADIQTSLERFMDDEELYLGFIKKFPETSQMDKLTQLIIDKDYENAVLEAHTLKGVTGNLGLVPLYEGLTEIINDMRAGNYGIIENKYKSIRDNYNAVCIIISNYR